MAQIFLSYRTSDREWARQTAAFLQAAGHDVWWDRDLIPGDSYRAVIDKQLDEADVVITIWTPRAVRSDWVISEAEHGIRLGKLLPLRTNDVSDWQIPKPFGTLHTQLVAEQSAILRAVDSIANRGERDAEDQDGRSLSANSPAAYAGASAESEIVTYLSVIGFGVLGVAWLAAHWSRSGTTYDMLKAAMLLTACALVASGVGIICFRAGRHARNPVYSNILTYLLSSTLIFVWLIAGSQFAYFGTGVETRITLFPSLAAIFTYVCLLIFQLRGRAWVFAAARLLAVVQLLAMSAHAAIQIFVKGKSTAWFTDTNPFKEALHHQLYVATHVTGILIAAAFLVAARHYSSQVPRAGRHLTN